MSNKQLICDECGSTYSYKDHKTVYDCLSADCDGSLVPDEGNVGKSKETDESDSSGNKIYLEKLESVQIDSEDVEWVDGSVTFGSGSGIFYPSHELTAGEGISYSPLTGHRCRVDCDVDGCDGMDAEDAPDLLERIKTATVCCGERMTPDQMQGDDVTPGAPASVSSARWRVSVSFICRRCSATCEFTTVGREMGEKISEFWHEHADNF